MVRDLRCWRQLQHSVRESLNHTINHRYRRREMIQVNRLAVNCSSIGIEMPGVNIRERLWDDVTRQDLDAVRPAKFPSGLSLHLLDQRISIDRNHLRIAGKFQEVASDAAAEVHETRTAINLWALCRAINVPVACSRPRRVNHQRSGCSNLPPARFLNSSSSSRAAFDPDSKTRAAGVATARQDPSFGSAQPPVHLPHSGASPIRTAARWRSLNA